MTRKQAGSLVTRIKFASYVEAIKIIMTELEIKPKVVKWLTPERNEQHTTKVFRLLHARTQPDNA
jgi:hypothetical protein